MKVTEQVTYYYYAFTVKLLILEDWGAMSPSHSPRFPNSVSHLLLQRNYVNAQPLASFLRG